MSITRLNHYLTESPHAVAQLYDRRALLWNIASKVTSAAIAALVIGVTVALLFGVSSTFLLVGVGLSLPVLFFFSQNCAAKGETSAENARIEHGVAKELEKTPGNLLLARANFLREEAVKANEIATRDYLRDDARYLAKVPLHPTVKSEKEYQENLEHLKWRYKTRQEGWKTLETIVFPAMLQSAILHELAAHPNQELELSDVGYSFIRPLSHRLYEEKIEGSNIYFVFKNGERPPLSADELKDYSARGDVVGLHQRMFGDPLRIDKSILPHLITKGK